jgi:predicted SAM-dependent methyltransferase
MTIATETPTKLDLACGQNKQEGFFGVDIADTNSEGESIGVDRVVDLLRFPWPFEDDSVEEVYCSHFVEHIPDWRPWWPDNRDGLGLFMDELWRICKHDAKVKIIHPYGLSSRAFQDHTHRRYLNEHSWPYFNLEARKQMGVDHYPTRANFAMPGISNGFHQEWMLRSDPARGWAAVHYWNVVTDLVVDLVAIKE